MIFENSRRRILKRLNGQYLTGFVDPRIVQDIAELSRDPLRCRVGGHILLILCESGIAPIRPHKDRMAAVPLWSFPHLCGEELLLAPEMAVQRRLTDSDRFGDLRAICGMEVASYPLTEKTSYAVSGSPCLAFPFFMVFLSSCRSVMASPVCLPTDRLSGGGILLMAEKSRNNIRSVTPPQRAVHPYEIVCSAYRYIQIGKNT